MFHVQTNNKANRRYKSPSKEQAGRTRASRVRLAASTAPGWWEQNLDFCRDRSWKTISYDDRYQFQLINLVKTNIKLYSYIYIYT